MYKGASKEHVITNAAGGKTLTLKKTNFPDTGMIDFTLATMIAAMFNLVTEQCAVVWNPWAEKAKAMGDFGDDEVNSNVSISVEPLIKDSPGKGQPLIKDTS